MSGAGGGRRGREANVRLIEAWYHRMWNRWDKSAFAQILDPDITFRGSLGQEKRGWAGLVEYMDFIRAAFPDFTNRIEQVICEGDQAFARLSYSGTHEGEIFGVAPTHTRVTYAGAAVFSFQGGRIREVWVLGDVHGLLRQLGG
jgi:steroid delta-isomerase-like uncharacterized protein